MILADDVLDVMTFIEKKYIICIIDIWKNKVTDMRIQNILRFMIDN